MPTAPHRPHKPGLLSPTAEFFAGIPTAAGVYIMRDEAGDVIYVGKAKNLRNRVRQYFRPGDDTRFFVAAGLLGRVLASVETVVVDNEKEALLLENHLIKRHQPRFNVKLRDDKQYLVLRIDPDKDYPRVEVVRNIRDDGARYFGPYHSATSCRQTLRTINRYFQLRTCTDHVLKTRKRPCLQYQIKRCPGPCVFPIDAGEYDEQVKDVSMFLAGKNDELVARLSERMERKAEAEEFEAAAQLRDSLYAVEKSLARQNIVQDEFVDQDVFGMWRDADAVEVIVLFIRGGKLVGKRSFRQRDQEFADSRVAEQFVQQYYATGTFVPAAVLVAADLDNPETVADWLSELRGKRVKIIAPKRGQKRRLIELANKNAAAAAVSRGNRDEDARAILEKLQKRLALRRLPRTIECYDIAHIQGTETVASRVVFVDGVPDKSQYRKFKVRSATNDDFAAMYEVLNRRFSRARKELQGGQDDGKWALPDLVVVDGGKGQLGSATAALRDQRIALDGERAIDLIALAKDRDQPKGSQQPDRVFLRNRKEPVALRANTTELYLLSRIRDEAHRFANTFHRQRRANSKLRSALDDIPGIGVTRRNQLLKHFGSLKAVKAATAKELEAAPGISRTVAEGIRAHFDDA